MYHRFFSVIYNLKKYGVMEISYNDVKIPILMDYKDMVSIKRFNKKWSCSAKAYVSCMHNFGTNEKEVFLHEVIMGLTNKENNVPHKNVPIIHINKIGIDNRRINLMYDTANKNCYKNIKKKERTITLPENSGIDVTELPTYVWYLKPNDTHGDRFIVEIGDFRWKTTSSNKVSLRYKLEEAKTCLRNLRNTRPDLFEDYSMNGEYNKIGKLLLNSFYKIIYKCGYNHIKKLNVYNLTEQYLEPGNINQHEKQLLKSQTFEVNPAKKRNLFNTIPKLSGCKELPMYCYYHPKSNERGDYFVICGHPSQISQWKSSTSKKISTIQKYNDAMQLLNTLGQAD